MKIEQNKQIDVFLKMIKQLPEHQFGKLFDYVEYLIFKEQKIFEQLKTKNNSENKYQYEVHELKMPTYKCGGMNKNFNRDDLYDSRI